MKNVPVTGEHIPHVGQGLWCNLKLKGELIQVASQKFSVGIIKIMRLLMWAKAGTKPWSLASHSESWEVNVMRQKTHSKKQEDSMSWEIMAGHEEVEGVLKSLRWPQFLSAFLYQLTDIFKINWGEQDLEWTSWFLKSKGLTHHWVTRSLPYPVSLRIQCGLILQIN